MLAVISPAKTFGEGSCIVHQHTQPELLQDSSKLITYLKKMPEKDIAKLMTVSPAIAKLNVQRYKGWKRSPSDHDAHCALVAFRGDVYRSLDSDSFDKKDFEFAQKNLRILSGLYGLLKPLDLIQAYRLEMGTRLKTASADSLYAFWGDKITDLLNRELGQQKSPVLVNLASVEYWKAVHKDKVEARIITPVFKEKRGQQYKVIGISAKRARGAMMRYIIKNRLRNIADIKNFQQDGYAYKAKLSSDDQWVFARTSH